MRTTDYIVTIGCANMDVTGYSLQAIRLADSNPGKIQFFSGGVGRNIAHNLALLGQESWLLTAIGKDLHGQSLYQDTLNTGVKLEKSLLLEDASTSCYLSLHNHEGEMVVAVNDMDISQRINREYLEPHLDFIQQAQVVIIDCNLNEETIAWLLENIQAPVFIDPVSAFKCHKVKNHLHRIHTFKPNALEAEILSGIKIESNADLARIAQWFHAQGLFRLVLSLGSKGVYYSEKDGQSGIIPAFFTHVINVTGAGDAMMAGLAACFAQGQDFVSAIKFAQACSSMTLNCAKTNNPDLSISNVKQLMENTPCLN